MSRDELIVVVRRQAGQIQEAVATGAALLWRVSATVRLPVLQWLPDGSYRSVLINPNFRGRRREALLAAAAGADLDPAQAMVVRVVEYMIEDRPGSGELFCLITGRSIVWPWWCD